MLKIIPESFATHTTEEIYSILLKSGETDFEVILPRQATDSEFEVACLLTDYYAALYCGELLAGVGSEFSYRVPLENSRLPFYFRFKAADITKLAEVVFHVASAADWLAGGERWNYYETEKNNFCFEEENDPVCTGLLAVIYDLLPRY